ncbi:RNA recognition motif protein [Gregarina niphandrodes]|uniref:RNA recognition motif protein n=1 Tax=Gregarina niphandrodes TaxID=110365 RepID=A0A023BD99_GRENI|nr:RNA recognition motif protein [Gregarina niphandrodes]EZG86967.1 RNA recognition motif protein [Gregarina niphandrodes]|eukprot:XP_011128723.1 RNA recognition motif protein [Gregarina niphandrodes]
MFINSGQGRDYLWIGNLPYETQVEDLWKLFGSVGAVESIESHRDAKTGRSTGWVFCHYQDMESASVAKSLLNGISYGGRTLAVEWAGNRDGDGLGMRSRWLRQQTEIASMSVAELQDMVAAVETMLNKNDTLKKTIVVEKPDEWEALKTCQAALTALQTEEAANPSNL